MNGIVVNVLTQQHIKDEDNADLKNSRKYVQNQQEQVWKHFMQCAGKDFTDVDDKAKLTILKNAHMTMW